MMNTKEWKHLVAERTRWVTYNFPDPDGKRTPLDSILGCIEELGELVHAELKLAQSIRGRPDVHIANAKDAVGDFTIYLLGVMAHYNAYPMDNWAPSYTERRIMQRDDVTTDTILEMLGSRLGRLCMMHANDDDDAETWSSQATLFVCALTWYLDLFCKMKGWDYDAIVKKTWDEVSERDWIKYPENGMMKEEIQ